MVLVIRVRPRQIERFVFISIILLLIATNVFFFTQWVPKDKAAVTVMQELPVADATQEATAEGSEAAEADDFEVLDLEELEAEVEQEEEPKEEEPEEAPVEEVVEEKEEEPEEEPEESEDSKSSSGKVSFNIDGLDWEVDGDKVRLETLYFTIENGLNEPLDNPRFHIYVYDNNDDDFLKSTPAGKFSLGKDVVSGDEFSYVIKSGETVTSSMKLYDKISKKNLLFTFNDADLQKTVKVLLKDSGSDTDESDTVKETP